MRGTGRGVFAVDEDAALAELIRTWAGADYHGFSVDNGTWSAIGSAGNVFTGATPDELGQKDPGALAGKAVMAGHRTAPTPARSPCRTR